MIEFDRKLLIWLQRYFYQGGDPSALPVDVRKHLLGKFCTHYAEQNIADLSFDISEVRRFANPDLAETINSLLETYACKTELCDLLLRIIWQGEIQGCSKKAFDFALDDKNEIYTRINGIRAIGVAGSHAQKKKLVNAFISDATIQNEELIGKLITAFAPDILNIQDVLQLIKRIKKSEAHTSLHWELEEFCRHKCPETDLFEWIVSILPLLKQPPFIERRYFEVSKQYSWLLYYSTLAAERLVLIKHTNALDKRVLETISLAQAARSFGDYHFDKHALIELVPKWSELNKALFWFDVESVRRYLDKKEERLTKWWQVRASDHFWRFTKEDFGKVLEDINLKSNMDDRMVALSLAFQIYVDNGRGKERRAALEKAVLGVQELEEVLNLYLSPPPMTDEERRWNRTEAYYKKRQKQRKNKDADNRRKWRESLKTNTGVLRDTSIASDGKVWDATNYLLNELINKKEDSSNWTQPHWENLIPEFGQDVAEAYRDGCIGYWRKYRPAIRSEGIENPNSTPNSVIVGLNGLEMEVRQNPDWPNNLSEEEAKLALRYAVNELSGFPKWLPQLHSVFPHVVEAGILIEIEWEFSQYDSETTCHYVLDDVVWQADWLKPKISNQILSFLKDYEPKHHDSVKEALGIVLADPDIDKEALIEIAKSKVPTMMSINRKVLWLAAWMCIDAKTAFETLSSTLSQIDNAEQATKFSMLFIVELLGGRHRNIQRKYQDYIQPEILLSLLKLMHAYIRRSEDINRTSGVIYSGELRDDGQDARNNLFQLLMDTPGKQTYLAMLDFAQDQTEIEYRKRYEMYAKRHAEADAELEPWQPGDIACFSEEAERAPQNHRELLDMTVSQLLDLKVYLEDGDTSIAEMIKSVKSENKETNTRNYIGGWLRDNSLGRYSVPQEEELADGKKPDIRIHGAGFDAPVSIELKIADNWSATEHVERLNNQLVGQYLRDKRSNCGIFLLVYCGEKTYWEHPNDGKKLDFLDLIRILKEEAKEIINKDNKVESIEIVGIDLTKRNITTVKKPSS